MICTLLNQRSQPRLIRVGLLLLGLTVGIGCGAKPAHDPILNPKHRLEFDIAEPGMASLKGKISHAGEPITAGRLCFFVKNALVPMVGTINNDGTYFAIGLPEGLLHVALVLDPDGEMPFPTPPKGPGMQQLPGVGPAGPPRPPTAPTGGGGPPQSGGPPMMPPPPMPGGPTGPENAPMVGMPLKFPPHLLGQLQNFEMPPQKKAEYQKLHKAYSLFGTKNKLTVNVKAGENIVDLIVP